MVQLLGHWAKGGLIPASYAMGNSKRRLTKTMNPSEIYLVNHDQQILSKLHLSENLVCTMKNLLPYWLWSVDIQHIGNSISCKIMQWSEKSRSHWLNDSPMDSPVSQNLWRSQICHIQSQSLFMRGGSRPLVKTPVLLILPMYCWMQNKLIQ